MQNNETIQRFDQGSKLYRTDSIKYRKLSADRVSQLANPTSSDIFLDIGCGTGTQLIELAETIRKGIGIDISPRMVLKANEQKAKAYCTNISFYEGDFISPEKETILRNTGINKIISNYALHHLDFKDKKKALEQMIDLGGKSLEMIVIGDLMFFDDPSKYTDQYDQIGFGPGTDLPCRADELAGLFAGSDFSVTLDQIHPLVGILKATTQNNFL